MAHPRLLSLPTLMIAIIILATQQCPGFCDGGSENAICHEVGEGEGDPTCNCRADMGLSDFPDGMEQINAISIQNRKG
jgi:hypothetical protein